MTFKRFSIVLFMAIAVLIGCKKNNQFTVTGKITHAEGDSIYLEELLVSSTRPVALAKINKDGEFKLKGEAGVPTFYLLKLSDSNFITLLVDSLENVIVEADAANFSSNYNISGSIGSQQIKVLNDKLNQTQSKIDSIQALNTIYRNNDNYDLLKAQFDQSYNDIVQDQVDFSTNFVKNNPFSMASVYALYQKLDNNTGGYIIGDLHTMKTAASALHSIYPDSEHVKALYQNTLQFVKEEQSERMRRFIQEQGENSPDILLPDPDGNEIALSSLRGKVVLLQFWAAEDRNSRLLNPLLVEAYGKYNRRGFEIYQVNVGENRIEWVDAIDKDNLTWINVGDLEGSVVPARVYNVTSVPSNYLLDREGLIIAKNLRGPDLDNALARALQ